jgi:hypothetical protein
VRALPGGVIVSARTSRSLLRAAVYFFLGSASVSAERWAMQDSKQRAVRFLEKEIKTYTALSLFLSKKGVREHLPAGANKVLTSPSYYKDRMKEAKKLVHDLRTSD